MARGFPTGPARVPAVRRAAVAALAWLASCVAPGADIHLAPLYSRTHTADSRVETEVLGGLWRHRRLAVGGELERLTVGPLYSLTPTRDGFRSNFLVPLGFANQRGKELRMTFFPLFVWTQSPEPDGTNTWQLAGLPGLLAKHNPNSGLQVGWFPFWGRLTNFLTYDRLVFFAWPLFVYAERGEAVSYHFLWPLLGWTSGGGESSFRVMPFYSRTKLEGRFDRTSILWPVFHYHRNHLGGDGELPETVWWAWPFYGRTTRGSYRAHTWLWPFFGYASDPRSGFWGLDFPWPFIRFQRGPDEVRRSRVWPFYSRTAADGLVATTFLWPLVHIRRERYEEATRDSVWVIPFWQSWDREDLETGTRSSWRKLFPVFQHEREGNWRRGSFPTLDPLWRNELIDRHYSWLWKLWEWEAEDDMRRTRSWLGLYKGERSASETRRSLAGLWSNRRYRVEGGKAVSETSLLFGLVRWRVTEDEGFDMLPIAFPGPGWPAQVTP